MQLVITFETIVQLRHPAERVLHAWQSVSQTQDPEERAKVPGQLRQPVESQVAHETGHVTQVLLTR